MSKRVFPPREALYPAPVVLVSSTDNTGKHSNIVTVAWCGIVCSNPPMLSVSLRPSRHSNKLIRDTGDFVVNIPSKDILRKVDMCGIVSGKGTDKFKLCSFTARPSTKIRSPIINECPVNIECKLKSVANLGVHDIFIGEILAVHVDDAIINKDGGIDYEKAAPFVYTQGEYWDLGKKIGYYGFSKK